MDGSAFVKFKRGRTGSKPDTHIIKIKRSETPDDIASAFLKEEGGNKDDNSENDYETSEDDSLNGEDDKALEDAYEKEEDGSPRRERRSHVSHGYHLVEGKMNHGMEDYLVAKHKNIDGQELGLYAIFDGHSGREVAEYLQSHLFENILNEPDFWTNPKKAVKRAYKDTDNDILENVVGSRGGSTAVTAILINTEKLVVANVGDSRAVLCKNGTAKQVTVDHDPLKEKELVESKGGFLYLKSQNNVPLIIIGNVPRVDGQLNMTRAFGDERLKKHITSEPDVVIKKIDEDIEFMILASDGLWKVMSNQEAVDCIRGLKDGREAAEELVKEALLRESKDDISCVVVVFHDN